MKIIVIGATGQLGHELMCLSQSSEHDFEIAPIDITDRSEVMQFVTDDTDVIINCAAYNEVDKAEDDDLPARKVNVEAVGYLAEAALKADALLIHFSTDYVFDGTAHIPYQETEATCPNSVYGHTKLAGEQNALTLCSRSMVIRTAWLYSTFGNNFVKTMIRLGKERENLGVIFDQVGTPTYARDLARAIFTAIRQGVVPGIYHFSNEGVCSWYDFTKAIHRLAGITTCHVKPLHTEEYPTPAKRPHYSVLDKTKIKNTYYIEIPYWMDSLQSCIAELEA